MKYPEKKFNYNILTRLPFPPGTMSIFFICLFLSWKQFFVKYFLFKVHSGKMMSYLKTSILKLTRDFTTPLMLASKISTTMWQCALELMMLSMWLGIVCLHRLLKRQFYIIQIYLNVPLLKSRIVLRALFHLRSLSGKMVTSFIKVKFSYISICFII